MSMRNTVSGNGVLFVLTGLLVLLIVSIIVLCWVPPVSRDALIHHLWIPKLYLQQGRIHEIPHLMFSYYPMNLELLYLIPLYFGNDIIPKLIHFSFALLTAGLIYRYIKLRLGMNYALGGSILFLSIPIVLRLSVSAYVDLGLIFFSSAALHFCMRWSSEGFQLKYLLISAVFCGMALGTKYNGLIVLLVLTLVVVFAYARLSEQTWRDQIKALSFGCLFVLAAVMVFSPWAIRNMKWTGNPVYPLYKNVFAAPQKPTASAKTVLKEQRPTQYRSKGTGHLSHFYVRKIVHQESWWQIALIPIRIFLHGRDDNPKYFDGRLNPFLLFFPFLSILGYRKNPKAVKQDKLILSAFSLLFLLIIYFQTDIRIRYIAPILPPLTILSIYGLKDASDYIRKRSTSPRVYVYTGVLYFLLIGLVGLNLAYLVGLYQKIKPMEFLSGRVNRDAFIEIHRPEYATLKYVNENLAEDVKLLGIFMGKRGYYCDREIVFDNNFIWEKSQKAKTPKALYQALSSERLTHLLIRIDLFNSRASSYSVQDRRKLSEFFRNNTDLIFNKNGYGLYRLKNQAVEE
jgi:4-amino-4-deoxy-L-arabinose transferase-like glycosyltransferase